jgi:hypothetical protein
MIDPVGEGTEKDHRRRKAICHFSARLENLGDEFGQCNRKPGYD